MGQIGIVPDALALERWRVHGNRDDDEKKRAKPVASQINGQLQNARLGGRNEDSKHPQGKRFAYFGLTSGAVRSARDAL